MTENTFGNFEKVWPLDYSLLRSDEVRRESIRYATRLALLAGALLAIGLAAFFVYWVGFRQAGLKFMLAYVGMFLFAPTLCVLATFGVFFLAYSYRIRRGSMSRVEFAFRTLTEEEFEKAVISKQAPSYDDGRDEAIGREVAMLASVC